MSQIIIPQRRCWTRQPQGPVEVGWSNPITHNLISAYTNGTDACSRVSANTAQRAISVAGRCDQYTGATSNGTTYVELGNSLGPTGPFTFVIWLWSDSELGGFDSAISQGDYATYRTKDSEFYTHNGGGWDGVQVGGARGYRGVGLYKVVCVHTGSQNIIYSETPSLGRRVDFKSCSPRSSPVNYPIRLGADAQKGRCLPGKIFVAHTLKRAVLASEACGLLENPWQIFRPRTRRTIISLGAPALPTGAELEAHAQAQASATANLTIAASLDGLALGVASANGTLSTQIPLAGAAVSVVSATGQLLSGIPLTAAAVAQASAAGHLTAQIRLDGNALAQAAAAAGLTSAILLAGSAQGQAAASGALTAGADGLEGSAQAQANAIATLTASIRLEGAAAAQAGVAGLLSTAIPLSAAALAHAIATGTLAVPILLAGHAQGQASASGVLDGSTVRPILDERYSSVIAARDWLAVAEPRDYSVMSVARNWEARL